ncbi:uncharacterized protein LOC129309113 [Prosopis cineraria]|uniref:uncharacterized protein LOC129309113 n=1 Tax=Prosopis cineraria TaxID=364024 RepID=UPI00240F64E9|nr:uncharacterized protein LOC129309113 [Prosopis cineraria]
MTLTSFFRSYNLDLNIFFLSSSFIISICALSSLLSLNCQTMLSHTQELTGNRHVSSSTPTCHAQSRHGSGDREFSFWCSSNTESSGNDCVRLQGRSGEGCGMHSPTSWETYKGTSFKSKNSTLIHGSHHCYSVSHDSRSKAIAESRKELMQTLQDLPESSFELSFQYLVQQQQVLQPVQNEAFIGKNSVNEAHVRKKDRKKKEKEKENNKPNQILRVEGMGNENFLLKMFFPSSLDWNKKAKVGNVPKLSPSFQESKEKRIKKSSPARENRSDSEDNTGESTNNSRKRSSKSRYGCGNFSVGCWPSLFSQQQRNMGDEI